MRLELEARVGGVRVAVRRCCVDAECGHRERMGLYEPGALVQGDPFILTYGGVAGPACCSFLEEMSERATFLLTGPGRAFERHQW
jgi:hypothetical protein